MVLGLKWCTEQATFRNYGKDSVIGSKTEEKNGKLMVTLLVQNLVQSLHQTSDEDIPSTKRRQLEEDINIEI